MTGNNFVLSRFTAIKNRHSRFTRKPLSDPHSWRKTQDFSKIESGPNYTTAAHAFVKATLILGLRAPFVACKNTADQNRRVDVHLAVLHPTFLSVMHQAYDTFIVLATGFPLAWNKMVMQRYLVVYHEIS